MKIFTVFVFLIISFSLNAQTADVLKGKWIFKKALNKGIDARGRKDLNAHVIDKMSLEFKSNSAFTGYILGQNMVGKWALSKDSKALILNASGEKMEFEILKLTETELILKIGLGIFLMSKT